MNNGDAMDWTPGDACRTAGEECDKRDVDACVVIMLDRGKDGQAYNTGVRVSGLKRSEVVALLESVKYDFIKMMSES